MQRENVACNVQLKVVAFINDYYQLFMNELFSFQNSVENVCFTQLTEYRITNITSCYQSKKQYVHLWGERESWKWILNGTWVGGNGIMVPQRSRRFIHPNNQYGCEMRSIKS